MKVNKILIANNSLPALKFILSMKKTRHKVEFYGLATKEDLDSTYITYLKNFVILKSGPSDQNFNNIKNIVTAAKKFNVDFVWPGWGYLSENSELPKILEKNNIGFIGPNATSMEALGNKYLSNILCEKLSIPVIPYIKLAAEKISVFFKDESNVHYSFQRDGNDFAETSTNENLANIDESLSNTPFKVNQKNVGCEISKDNNSNLKTHRFDSLNSGDIESYKKIYLKKFIENKLDDNDLKNIKDFINSQIPFKNEDEKLDNLIKNINNKKVLQNENIIQNTSKNNDDQNVINELGYTDYKNYNKKINSFKLTNNNEVITTPNINEDLTSINQIKEFFQKYEFPLILKASLSGGGKGIRIINNFEDLKTYYETIKNEGQGEIILCQIIKNARHVELQILSDKKGNVICLGGRDCTIQRRHQKLIEESINMDGILFEHMKCDAIKLVKEVGYEGVATVEFLMDSKNYYFLEVNTRIQVEHPITELKYNCNIPEIQYLIATGYNLATIQCRESKKHVIGVRIVAENSWCDFTPTLGKFTITVQGQLNSFVYFSKLNGEISKFSDSQFGHVFVKNKNRKRCIEELISLLNNIKITGINTNIDFIISLLKSKLFYKNKHNIKTIENILIKQKELGTKNIDLLCNRDFKKNNQMIEKVKYENNHENNFSKKKENPKCDTLKPFLQTKKFIEPFISFAVIYSLNSEKKNNEVDFKYNNVNYKIEYYFISSDTIIFKMNDSYLKISFYKNSDNVYIFTDALNDIVSYKRNENLFTLFNKEGTHVFHINQTNYFIYSPTDGKIIQYFKKDGDDILSNEKYVEIEIMKMRLTFNSEQSGRFKRLAEIGCFVKEGDKIAHIMKVTHEEKIYYNQPFDHEYNIINSNNSDNLLYFHNICLDFNVFFTLFDNYVFPDEFLNALKLSTIKDCNKIIDAIQKFYQIKIINEQTSKFMNIIVEKLSQNFQDIGNFEFKYHLIDILELIDNIIIEMKMDDKLYDCFVRLKYKIAEFKFKKMYYYRETILNQADLNEYIERNCNYKEGILFSIKFIKSFRNNLVKIYLKRVFEINYEEFLITECNDHIRFELKHENKKHDGIFLFCENGCPNISGFNLMIHFDCHKTQQQDCFYINIHKKSPFITYTFNNVSILCDDIFHCIIKNQDPYPEPIYKDIFRNLCIYKVDKYLTVVYKIDTHSGNSIMDVKNLSHAIKQTLCSIMIMSKKHNTIASKLIIDVEGIIKIKNEYVYSIADDCVFYYSKDYITNNVIKCEIKYKNKTSNRLVYSIEKGFLEKFIYKNEVLMIYEIDNKQIYNNRTNAFNHDFINIINNKQTISNRIIARKNNTVLIDDFLFLVRIYLYSHNINFKITEYFLNYEPSDKNSNDYDSFAYNDILYFLANKETEKIGMRGFKISYNENELLMVHNDISFLNGSFSIKEYIFYVLILRLARKTKIPFIFISCNSGARIGLFDKLKEQMIYSNDKLVSTTHDGVVCFNENIVSIFGNKDSGPENLSFSGLLANETYLAYKEILTISYVTGRSVGIGAYLNKLGQRIIQKKNSPILLTGFQSLNKLLQSEIYKSNEEIGGWEVMNANGNNHLEVINDYQGIEAIFKWLDFYFTRANLFTKDKRKNSLNTLSLTSTDKINKYLDIYSGSDYNELYNEREILENILDFDSLVEYKPHYGQNIILGRGKINNISIGIISTESGETKNGSKITKNVLFPDSSDKIAQGISDFEKEGLDILIIANFKGFAGGKEEMTNNVLKHGSAIVEKLSECKTKVIIYIPPNGEVRGGSWVVFDKNINQNIVILSHPSAKIGIMQSDGIAELKFKEDERKMIFNKLNLIYTKEAGFKMAVKFCELHDNPLRMYLNKHIDNIVTIANLKQSIMEILLNK